MAADRFYYGTATGAGPVLFSSPMSRPVRENSLGQSFTDGPYEELDFGAYSKLSVVTEDDAELTIEGCIGELWGEIDKVTGSGAFSFTDLVYAKVRITSDKAASVNIALGC